MKKELTIGIIKFNTPNDEKECIKSVLNNVTIPYDLIAFQNNLGGYSFGANKIVEMAQTEFVAVLSADTLVSKNSIELMLNAIKSDENCVIVGPTTSKAMPPQKFEIAEYFKDEVTNENVNLFAKIMIGQVKLNHPEQIYKLSLIHGFAFIVRKKLWDRLDGFPENCPDYGSEQVFASKYRKAGYTGIWVPSAYIHHYGERSQRLRCDNDESKFRELRKQGDETLVQLGIQPKEVLLQYGD